MQFWPQACRVRPMRIEASNIVVKVFIVFNVCEEFLIYFEFIFGGLGILDFKRILDLL